MTLYDVQGNYLIGAEIPLSTRKGNLIPNERRMPWPQWRLQNAQTNVLQYHPNVRTRSLTNVYNCMGMVFASRRTCVDPEHLRMILNDDDYKQVNDIGQLQPGDVVVYQDDRAEISHVGLVAEVKPDLVGGQPQVTILSQWGGAGEYFHRADDVNPLLGKPTEYWTDRI